jgi:hypothetical protein
MRSSRSRRRGLAIPEHFVVLGLLAITIVWFVGGTGRSTAAKMDGDLNGPTGIIGRQATAATGSAATAESVSKPKGNNGVGNGEDGQPPGDPPINDGEGTSPGNPGNQGGAQ